jgi:hypothetical protein
MQKSNSEMIVHIVRMAVPERVTTPKAEEDIE